MTSDKQWSHLDVADLELIDDLMQWANMKGIEGHIVHDVNLIRKPTLKGIVSQFNCMVEENEDI